MLDRKCERPFLPKHRELLARFLGAAIPLDPIWRCHARSRASKGNYIKPERPRCQGLRRSVAQVIGRAALTLFRISRMFAVMLRALWRAAVVSWQLNANQFSSGNDAKSLDGGRGSTQFGGEGSYCRREKM
jgi:hypothetical protein